MEYNENKELKFENLHMPWWGYLLLFVAIYFGASVIVIVASTIFKMGLTEEQLADPVLNANISNILEVVAYIILLAVFAVIFRKSLKEIFSRIKLKSTWIWVALGLAILYGGSLVYTQILDKLHIAASSANQDSIVNMVNNTPLAGFLFVCLLAPIMEELMFRLGLYRSIKNPTVAFIVTVVLFASMHLVNSIMSGTLLADLSSFPSYLIGAFGLTLVYHKSKSIIASIITHITYNTIAFIAMIATMNSSVTTETVHNIVSFFANLF